MSNKFLEELVLQEQGLPSEVPAPGTVALYTKPSGLYFMRSDAVEVGPILPQVAQPAPSNMATTDTIQTFTAAKTFTAAPTVPDNSFSIAKVNGLTTALADKYSATNPPPVTTPSNMVTTDTSQTITGNKQFNGVLSAAGGNIKFDKGGTAIFNGWIDMPTGLAGIGSGGVGATTWVAVAGSSGQFFSDVTGGDTIYRGTTGKTLRLGVSNAAGSNASTMRVTETGVAVVGTLSATGNITENGVRVYSSNNLPPAPTNMVTTDTSQTITGAKSFSNTTTLIPATAATSGTTQVNSPSAMFVTRYWTGSASADALASINLQRPSGVTSFVFGADGRFSGALYENGVRVVTTTDTRLSDARTPTAHTHGVTDLSATGTRDATTFLRGDGTWATVSTSAPANMVTTDTAQTITGAKTFSGAFRATGTVAQAEAGVSRLDVGVEVGTPRIIFEDSSVASGTVGRVWAVDNSGGSFRWFTPGVVKMTLSSAGALNTAGAITQNGTAVVLTNDGRLSDARTPTAHTHTAAQISNATNVGQSVITALDAAAARTAIGAGTSSFSGAYADLSGKPTLGTASTVDFAPNGGNAAFGQVVMGGDTRLSDARTPTAHTHTASQISDSTTVGRSVVTAVDAAAARTAIGAGTSSFSGAYSALSGIPTTFAPSAHTHNISDLNATGTRDNTTFLRGDGTWAVVTAGGGTAANVVTSANATANKYTVAASTAAPAAPAVGDVWLVTDLHTPGAPSGNGTVDLSNYVTLNGAQTITAVKTFGVAPVVPDSSFTIAKISATGTRDASTVLRGDGTFAPQSLPAIPFSMAGTATVKAGTFKFPIAVASVIDSVMITAGTAPTGSALIADVHVNGTSIYTTQANRPSLQPGVAIATAPTSNITALAAGDYITVDIDQIGSSVAGSDIMVVVRFRRA